MIITITTKLEAETRGELIDSFAANAQGFKNHMETSRTEGLFGPPEKVILRFLLIGGQWKNDATTENQVPPVP